VGFSGRDGGEMLRILRDGDVSICVDAKRTARIQEVHLVVLHSLCEIIDYLLLGE
jgi:D-sedoheptulose 7-phosphate isomerase